MSSPPLGRAWLASHLPHRGAMNLLDEIVAWDAERLRARSRGHGAADHPLRRGGELPIASAIEYAAQAVAAHGALLADAGAPPAAGYLASVRGVEFHAHRLDGIAAALDIEVKRYGEGAGGVLYGFRVAADGTTLARGRVAIVLDASAVAMAAREP